MRSRRTPFIPTAECHIVHPFSKVFKRHGSNTEKTPIGENLMRLCCETWRCREHEARKRILVLITSLAIFPYVLLAGPLRLTEAMRLQPENYNPQKGTGEWLGNGHRWMSGLKRIRQERSFECTKKLVRLARLFTSREARRRTVERGAENWGRSGWGLFSIPVTREKTNCKSDIGPPVSQTTTTARKTTPDAIPLTVLGTRNVGDHNCHSCL